MSGQLLMFVFLPKRFPCHDDFINDILQSSAQGTVVRGRSLLKDLDAFSAYSVGLHFVKSNIPLHYSI